MRHINFLIVSLFSVFVLVFAGCKEDDEKTSVIEKTKVSGYVEKGPFISGSEVTIYELDDELNGTGKIFGSKTDNTGYFEINALKLASKYVKLSVNGFFFNEVTGALSTAPITLEAIADIENNDQINVNILTHLEMERVKKLILEDKKTFAEAKEQAEKELLACFMIDKNIVPEKAGITNNDVAADVLIAVSSILLRNHTEAQFSELISFFSNDLKSSGTVREEIKEAIKQSSYGLNYTQVKENILNRYESLGFNVEIGNFHYYIDGDGDGQLEEKDYPIAIAPEEFFTNEEHFRMYLASSLNASREATENYFLFDALYTQSPDIEALYMPLYYREFCDHRVSPDNNLVADLFGSSYRAVRDYNVIIEKAIKDEFLKFRYASQVYRAYHYWMMTELWGNVPLMLSANLAIDESLHITQTPKAEILEQLVSDLTSAIPYLPAVQDGIICSGDFAKALLARVYLSLKDYSNAGTFASEIIQNGRYQLETPQSNAFAQHNTETIMSFDTTSVVKNQFFNQNIKKGKTIPVVRYAEVLLTAAETGYRQGNYPAALQSLNIVRSRNGKPALTNADAATISDALLEEWETDLSKEGLWFIALKRFGLSETVLGIPSYMNLLPIPGRELIANPNIVQNPGY